MGSDGTEHGTCPGLASVPRAWWLEAEDKVCPHYLVIIVTSTGEAQ